MNGEHLPSGQGEIVLYSTPDGRTEIQLRVQEGSVWLTQLEMADLLGTSKQNASLHILNILKEKELPESSVVKESLTTAADGKSYRTKLYRLEMILSVGYRVKSKRGTQFRQWATANLSEYLVKGFVMNDERLKNPGGWDYFDELLARIREIRASEKRFYQKVRELFALSADYRADPATPNMALTTWSGSRVRKHDVIVAKNYLSREEIDTLNRLVVIFLEQAELRARERKELTLDYWRSNVDRLLEFSERPVLKTAGTIGNEEMKTIAHERYEIFALHRREAEALAADAEDIHTLEAVEKKAKRKEGI
jgi:hypothetical protein